MGWDGNRMGGGWEEDGTTAQVVCAQREKEKKGPSIICN